MQRNYMIINNIEKLPITQRVNMEARKCAVFRGKTTIFASESAKSLERIL
jgi:hypothetical protein